MKRLPECACSRQVVQRRTAAWGLSTNAKGHLDREGQAVAANAWFSDADPRIGPQETRLQVDRYGSLLRMPLFPRSASI